MIKKIICFLPHVLLEVVLLTLCAIVVLAMYFVKKLHVVLHRTGDFLIGLSKKLPDMSWYFGEFSISKILNAADIVNKVKRGK